MSRRILEDIIDDFNIDKFAGFFRSKSDTFVEIHDDLTEYDDPGFIDFQKIGEIEFQDLQKLVVISAKVTKDLTQKSGKKDQYDKAKRLLKQSGTYDAGIFIFYDDSDNFRFSLIYGQAVGTKRSYSNFKRFTYFVSPDLTNTTFLKQIGDGNFSAIEKIKEAFSVEAVNKEFYKQIARSFYDLVGGEAKLNSRKEIFERGLKLPIDENQKSKFQEFAVRLIGRLVFCWFLKKKKSENGKPLIPEKLLSSNAVSDNYYHFVLEPLFFQILNTPIKDRNSNYPLGKYIDIPFLNGGLFEPHDDDYYEIDKGTGISKCVNTVVASDDWFRELFEVFKQYNFTIDENTTVDVELSIDPEMLGRIFENLLAEINPETGETARKSTGSYYTPRPIVEYMVDESLKQYLLTKTDIKEDILARLLSYEYEEIDLSEKQKDAVIEALDKVKIIDPACGSGAFPMGILHKILLILQKVDPDNKRWLEKVTVKVGDSLIAKNLRIENPDYVRKLGIIRESIYGVDIQPIAVEISKLRFFLSLIVDENIDDTKPNRGIEPLPNLEFKFVAANSLLGLPKQSEQFNLFEADDEIEQLKKLRDAYFTNYGEQKKIIEQEFKKVQDRMFAHVTKYRAMNGGVGSQTVKLSEWNPFSDKASDWFDSEWMFGVPTSIPFDKGGQRGFDIVIGNPPYGAEIDGVTTLAKNYKHYDRQKNSASFFIEIGNKLTNSKGVIAYIIPKSLSFSEGWKKTRELVTHKNRLLSVIDVCKAFEAVLLEQIIICFSKEPADSAYQFSVGEGWDGEIKVRGKGDNKLIDRLDILPMYIDNRKQGILNKLEQGSVLLSEISKTFRGLPFQRKVSKSGQPILRGKNIGKYKIYGDIDNITLPEEILSSAKVKEILMPKIISQRLVAHVMNPYDRIIIMATIDKQGLLTLDTVMNTYLTVDRFALQYVLAILNSQLASWFYYWFVFNRAVRTMDLDKYYIGKLPVKDIDLKAQQPFITLVESIIAAKQNDPQADTSALEKQIDVMVYKLYNLTPDEIAIVEKSGSK